MDNNITKLQIDTISASKNNLREQDWYRFFIEDLQSLIIETEFNSRWALIEMYHSIGKRITEETESFNHAQIYNSQIYETVAKDIKKSKETIFKAVQFYKKFPNAMVDVSSLPEGKNTSWSKIVNNIGMI